MPAVIPTSGKTTAQNAAAAAKENMEKQQAAAAEREKERAKLKPRKNSPLKVRSRRFDLRDPDTAKHLPAGEIVELPFAGGWLRSQIQADLVEVIDGDPNHAVEDDDGDKEKDEKGKNDSKPEATAPVKEPNESDADFAKRVEAFEALKEKK